MVTGPESGLYTGLEINHSNYGPLDRISSERKKLDDRGLESMVPQSPQLIGDTESI